MKIPRYEPESNSTGDFVSTPDGAWCKWEDVQQALKEMKARTETVEPIASVADLRVMFPDENE